MSAGNRTSGRKKSIAALKGIGQKSRPNLGRNRHMRASLACSGFENVSNRLTQMVRSGKTAGFISKYAKSIVQRVHKRRDSDKILVTLIEGPSFPESNLSDVNAELGGASLRIVEPLANGSGKMKLKPPKLKLGFVVEWPLDLFTQAGVTALCQYLGSVQPVAGTGLVH